MKKPLSGQQNYLDAFIKTAQYLAGLTIQQDIWSEIGKVLVNFFGADLAGFGERSTNGEIIGHHWALPDRVSCKRILTAEMKDKINEVLESGFLATHQIYKPKQYSIAILPITQEHQTTAAMLVGYRMSKPLPKELLNVFLAISRLAGVNIAKLAEEGALRESEASLAEAQRIAHIGNWELDLEKNETTWSDEHYRIFGLKPQEFVMTQETFSKSVHPDDMEFVNKSIDEALKGKPYSIDFRIVLPNGTERIVHSQAKVFRDKKGKPIRMVGTVHDITERKRAEDRIKHLNAVLLAIRKVNQLIVKEKDRDRLLQSACDNLIKTRGYYNAWIALLDESGKLVTTAESGVGEDFSLVVEQLKRRKLTDCMRGALSQSEVWIIKDPPSTCSKCPIAAKYSGKGAMAARLEHGGKVYGMLTVSIPHDFVTDEKEQTLFKEIVEDIAFALHGIELEGERKRAEEALRESEERHRRLIETMNEGLNVLDENGLFIYVNDKYCEIFGYSRDEMIGHHISEFIDKRNRDILKEQLARERKGERTSYEIARFRKDGQKIFTITSAAPILDANGHFKGSFAVVTDITERKRAEEALGTSEVYHRTLVENLPQKIFLKDLNSTYISCNKNYAKDLKIKSKDIAGKTDFDFHPEPLAKKYREDDKNVMKAGQITEIEEEYVVNGKTFYVHTDKVPIKDEKGKVTGLLGIFWDITERKNAEKAMIGFVYKVNDISPGECYLHKSSDAAYNIFTQLVLHGVPGLCLSREKPTKLLEYGIPKEHIILLSSTPLKGFKAIENLQEIGLIISDFLKKHEKPVVLLDGLTYLMSRFAFKSVYKFIQEKRFNFIEADATLLMPVDLAAFTDEEKALLTSEVKLLG